jgi:hypothetical protein
MGHCTTTVLRYSLHSTFADSHSLAWEFGPDRLKMKSAWLASCGVVKVLSITLLC